MGITVGIRTKRWLIGGWVALVLGGWFLTDAMDDGITPTSGPQPSPTVSTSPSPLPGTDVLGGCPSATPSPTETSPPAVDRMENRHTTGIQCVYVSTRTRSDD